MQVFEQFYICSHTCLLNCSMGYINAKNSFYQQRDRQDPYLHPEGSQVRRSGAEVHQLCLEELHHLQTQQIPLP